MPLQEPMSRRTLLKGMAAGGAGVLASSLIGSFMEAGAAPSRHARIHDRQSGAGSKTLVVRDSGGAYEAANRKHLYDPFTRETGIDIQTVNLDFDAMLAQLKTGSPQFTTADTSMVDYLIFHKTYNLMEELDYDKLPNIKHGGIAKNLVLPYAVGKNYWASTMAYRSDVFKKDPPKNWEDFWNTKKWPGKRSLQSATATYPELEFYLLADGVTMHHLYPLDVERAFKSADRIRTDILKWWTTGSLPPLLLSRKEVVMSSIWNGRALTPIKQGVPIALQWWGARRQSNGFGIFKGARNVEGAYKFLNFAYRPEVQAALAVAIPYSPVVPKANKLIPKHVLGLLPTAPKYFDVGFDLDNTWWLKHGTAMTKRWTTWAAA